MLCKSQNGLLEHLQASYTLCGNQNSPYTLCGDENGFLHNLRGLRQRHTRLVGIKTDFPSLCSPTLFKADSPNIHKPPTRFAVGKMNSARIYKPSTGQKGLVEVLQASYTLRGGRNGLPGLLQP